MTGGNDPNIADMEWLQQHLAAAVAGGTLDDWKDPSDGVLAHLFECMLSFQVQVRGWCTLSAESHSHLTVVSAADSESACGGVALLKYLPTESMFTILDALIQGHALI
jgi:hypothetical protein